MSLQNASNKTITQSLLQAKTALTNVTKIIEIQELFSALGYTPEKIAEGAALHTKVSDLIAKQKAEYGEQFAATKNREELQQAAEKQYKRTFKLARIAFEDDKAAENALELLGKRKQSISGWLDQTTLFYKNLIPNEEYLQKLITFGYTSEKLLAEKGAVEAVIDAIAKQKQETGEAQAATKERDEQIDLFFGWMSTFYKIADIALEDHPQWKEKIGLFERS